MYPERELTRLAAHKTVLRRGIAQNRGRCAVAMVQAAHPLTQLDRMLDYWRRSTPLRLLATVSLGFLLKRRQSPGLKILGAVARWGPLARGMVRAGVQRVRQKRFASS